MTAFPALAMFAALLSGTVAAPAAPPTDPEWQTIGLAPATARTAAPHTTRPFRLVGATWNDVRARLGGTVQIRTRAAADGAWTGWQTLESDATDGPRGSTDPLWVAESNAVEARVTTPDGLVHPQPAGLRLDLINPGPDRARPVPGLVSRAGWGANESIIKHAPEYTTDVQVMFVHHTATSNNYTCAQSASIVRGIELFHVRSRGWNDIGYNFLVDKCGTLFEGRKGGVDRPVLGAHTLGFNAHSSAISVIGNYTAAGAPARVRAVIAQVAAYKLGAYGNSPSGRVVLTSNGSDRFKAGTRVTLNRISGHRDTGRTECPGTALYAQLGGIRAAAARL